MQKYDELLSTMNAIQKIEFKNYLINNIIDVISFSNDSAKIIEDNVPKRICSKCKNIMCLNGHTKEGTQKYICKCCGNTCCSTTGTVTYHSKKDFSIWMQVINYMLDNLSIRKIAKRLNLSPTTVFNIRHKIFIALSRFLDSQQLKGEVQADEEYKKINLKGTKLQNMPRLSKKRSSSGLSGVSHHKVCITIFLDCYDDLRMKIAGLGPATTDMIEDTMGKYVDNASTLITDSKSSYMNFCNNHNLKWEAIPSGCHNTETHKNIQKLNGVHAQFNSWLDIFKGVSIRHLQGYIDWFCYTFILSKRYEEDKMKVEIYKDIIVNSKYIKTGNICKKEIPINLEKAYGEYHYGIFAQ